MDPEIITDILEMKYLDVLGITPVIDGCSLCGNDEDIVTIDVDAGGYVCKDCYTNQKIYSDKTIKLIRMFYYVDIDKISKLSIHEDVKKEMDLIIDKVGSKEELSEILKQRGISNNEFNEDLKYGVYIK